MKIVINIDETILSEEDIKELELAVTQLSSDLSTVSPNTTIIIEKDSLNDMFSG